MATVHLCALLRKLRDQLADESRFLGVVSRRRRRRELLARVQAVLAVDADDTAPSGLIEATRQTWAAEDRVLIADRAPCRVDRAGVWIGAWIRAATGPGSRESIDPERLAAAIAALPPLARDVFTLSSRGSLDYPAIAAALGISEDLVRRELAAALVAIDQTLTIQQRDNPSPIA